MSMLDELEEFVDTQLPSAPAEWCQQRKNAKIIHDALWGTFEIAPHEVALLDTPLLQRLRFIHQTGAVNLTYPSALHTRFEHTLGVMFQAGRICTTLRNRRGEGVPYGDDPRFNVGVEQQARFAALVHDTGHGPFSHTSEQYFTGYDQITEAKKEPRFHESGAGEILSCLMLQTKKFKQFVAALNDVYRLDISIESVSNMITGYMDDEHIYLSEIVHGPFDADKIDYMHRDGMFSGLKMHVDVDRLYASIGVATSTETILGKEQTMKRLAGSMAGTSPLSQIMFNKMILFTGIYHHHKVRAVDCMLWAIFEIARYKNATVGNVHLNSPVDFLRLTDDRVLTPELSDDEDIRSIINKIRTRQTWKRALVISRHTVPDEMHDPTKRIPEGPFLEIVKLSSNRPENIRKRREIAHRIWQAAGEPCSQHEVWFDAPKPPSMEESERMWIASPGMPKPVTLGEFLPIQEWVELYGTHQWKAHVFCPPDARRAINAAAKYVLKEEFGLEVNDMATGHAHIDR